MIAALISLVGVIIGWALKALTDSFVAQKAERQLHRTSIYHLLTAYKALLDYERFTRNLRRSHPPVEEFEEDRQIFARRFLKRVQLDKASWFKAVERLSAVDPCLAVRTDNTLKNICGLLSESVDGLVPADESIYDAVLAGHDHGVDFTLYDLERTIKRLAWRCGLIERIRVQLWFRERHGKGEKEFQEGFDRFMSTLRPPPENKVKAFLQVLVDPGEWDNARWSGTVFVYDPADLTAVIPGLGIGFANGEAGKTIFEHWRKRLETVDKYDEIRVSIIEGPIPGNEPNSYVVMISSNPEATIKRLQDNQPDFKPEHVMIASRMHTMKPAQESENLKKFKDAVRHHGRYRIFPAHVEQGKIKSLQEDLAIEKTEIHFLHTSEIKPTDPENVVLKKNKD